MTEINQIKLRDFCIGGSELVVIAGPCVIEEDVSIIFKIAEKMKEVADELKLPYVFKASFDKANRTSIDSYRGGGIEKGLNLIQQIKERFDVPVLTDIHSPDQAESAAEVADILQIPAFLCRQTDLLVAAAKTGKIINIKKGQFLAPQEIANSAKKVIKSGNNKVFITERGTTFGYNNLVVDMRSVQIIQGLGYPLIFDATHSVQLPGGSGDSSSGQREYVETLAKAAVAAGCKGLFFEVHPNPDKSPCDGPNMIALDNIFGILKTCKEIFEVVNKG